MCLLQHTSWKIADLEKSYYLKLGVSDISSVYFAYPYIIC